MSHRKHTDLHNAKRNKELGVDSFFLHFSSKLIAKESFLWYSFAPILQTKGMNSNYSKESNSCDFSMFLLQSKGGLTWTRLSCDTVILTPGLLSCALSPSPCASSFAPSGPRRRPRPFSSSSSSSPRWPPSSPPSRDATANFVVMTSSWRPRPSRPGGRGHH